MTIVSVYDGILWLMYNSRAYVRSDIAPVIVDAVGYESIFRMRGSLLNRVRFTQH
jgi:hypothetical protein